MQLYALSVLAICQSEDAENVTLHSDHCTGFVLASNDLEAIEEAQKTAAQTFPASEGWQTNSRIMALPKEVGTLFPTVTPPRRDEPDGGWFSQ